VSDSQDDPQHTPDESPEAPMTTDSNAASEGSSEAPVDPERVEEPAVSESESEGRESSQTPEPGPAAGSEGELPPVADSSAVGKESPEGLTLPAPALVAAALVIALVFLWLGAQLGHQDSAPSATPDEAAAGPQVWTCSMHPTVKLPEFGACPLCGMDLIPLQSGGAQEPRVLKLTEAAAALAGVETVPVERRAVTREVRMVGLVEVDETRLHYVSAWFPGRLDRLFVDYTGTSVSPGDHLAEVYSPELLTAQEELLQAIAARARLGERATEFLQTSADRTVRSAREKLRLWGLSASQIEAIEREGKSSDHVTIHATSGGVVVHKNKNRGDYVKTGERIYAIADLSQVWVKLDAYESDLNAVRYGQEVRFETEAYPGEVFEGRVVFIDPVVTRHTRTVKVRLNVANAEGRLKPGMFVRATLRAGIESDGQALAPAVQGKWICPMHPEEIHDAQGKCSQCAMPLVEAESLFRKRAEQAEPPLVIPASAVLWTGVRSVVYVQRPKSAEERGGAYEGRVVVLGPRAGGVYIVREGLQEGELVVTKGAFKIDSALQIEARPSMMLPSPGSDSGQPLEVPQALRRALSPVYQSYIEAQTALAKDQLEPARSALGTLVAVVEAIEPEGLSQEALRAWVGLAKRLRDAGTKGAAAAEIGALRLAFQDASRAILELERSFGHATGRYVEAYCPMAFDNAGAAWLQVGEELNNPYFGASMLRCGDVKARFEPREGDPHAGHEHAPAGSPSPPPASPSPASSPLGALRERLAELVQAYLALQHDLSRDKARGAAHSKRLHTGLRIAESGLSEAEARAWKAALPELGALTKRLGAAKGIGAERIVFERLSLRLDALLSQVGTPSGVTLRRFNCSMAFGNKGADWLQTAERTENPYFGSGMYRCGSQVRVLEAAPEQGEER
jgi:membrane fusion protein, copper/silver efflux system